MNHEREINQQSIKNVDLHLDNTVFTPRILIRLVPRKFTGNMSKILDFLASQLEIIAIKLFFKTVSVNAYNCSKQFLYHQSTA
jgi:hypothetical protein